ncbi:hypothetical protein JOB18_039338 [Solea senegalensis]|uniref:Uncharacterized protein n=1 Tax=Solea senegalensis TaxID=28829 RepID=A0AAV6QN59_SOLSE|nr:hypothetical protein JOB18_039338 [Solea senegalensis]
MFAGVVQQSNQRGSIVYCPGGRLGLTGLLVTRRRGGSTQITPAEAYYFPNVHCKDQVASTATQQHKWNAGRAACSRVPTRLLCGESSKKTKLQENEGLTFAELKKDAFSWSEGDEAQASDGGRSYSRSKGVVHATRAADEPTSLLAIETLHKATW